MTEHQAKETLDKIFAQIFGAQNPFTLEEFRNKFAFDIRMPERVAELHTNQDTWTSSLAPNSYVKYETILKEYDGKLELTPQPIHTMSDILLQWGKVNPMATERILESEHVSQSDTIMKSQYVFRSMDINSSNHVLFCDGIMSGEYVAAGQRSNNINYSAKIDDSTQVSQSFAVTWSQKISRCLFINNCDDMYESMFCSHIRGKRYCIANMQYSKEEYMRIKPMVIEWIFSS